MAKSHCDLKLGQGAVGKATLVLLLLLNESLADNVCIHINGSNTETNVQDATIVDDQGSELKCRKNGISCFFSCNSSQEFSQLYGVDGSICFSATVRELPDKIEYLINQSTTCHLYPCHEQSIMPLLRFLDNNHSYAGELMQLTAMRASCPQLFSDNRNMKTTFLKVESHIIHNIMDACKFKRGPSRTYPLKSLSLNVFNISDVELNTFDSSSRIQFPLPQLLPQNSSFIPDIWLPTDALFDLPEEERIIGLVSYLHNRQFQFGQVNIASTVIRIEHLGQKRLQNLNMSIEMIFRTFPYTEVDNNSWLQCHYLDENDWLWKTDGCKTQNRTSGNETNVTCTCDHATPFAVLLIRGPIPKEHWEILSRLSYIGCSLSAFFTALSIVLYVFNRSPKVNYAASIHVSLSVALFLLNTAFLLTEWGASLKADGVCVFIAALIHYSLLCCFTWMAIEALHLYLLLIRVFTTFFKHYMLKLSLAGWGIPAIIVAVSLAMKDFKQIYGLTEISLAGSSKTSATCWIKDNTYFYSVNLTYFSVIFLFNFSILITVAINICRMKQALQSSSSLHSSKRKSLSSSDSCRSSITVLGITCLLGTTWGLAFLGSGYVSYPILYLFCILNSTQGFCIFLWICLSTRRQRRIELKDSTNSTNVTTSMSKSD